MMGDRYRLLSLSMELRSTRLLVVCPLVVSCLAVTLLQAMFQWPGTLAGQYPRFPGEKPCHRDSER
jgi:hypothetical protein